MRWGDLAQHLDKFICESTNVHRAEGDMPVQEGFQSASSQELVEVEVREFLEKVFSGGE